MSTVIDHLPKAPARPERAGVNFGRADRVPSLDDFREVLSGVLTLSEWWQESRLSFEASLADSRMAVLPLRHTVKNDLQCMSTLVSTADSETGYLGALPLPSLLLSAPTDQKLSQYQRVGKFAPVPEPRTADSIRVF
jgi:hypothetical protein